MLMMMSQRQQNLVLVVEAELQMVEPMTIETKATTGIVRPIAASTDPNARLRLVCRRLDAGRPQRRQALW